MTPLSLWPRRSVLQRGLTLGCALAVQPLGAPQVQAAETIARYRLAARFDPASGRLKARVEVTLPPAEAPQDLAFILGGRFTLAPVEAGPGARVGVEPTDTPLPGLQKIVIRYARPPTRPVKLRFAYEGPVNGADGPPAFSAERIELNLEEAWLPIREDLGLAFAIDADIRGLPPGIVAVAQGDVRQSGDRLTVRRAAPDSDLTLIGAPGLTMVAGPDVEFHAAEQDDPLIALMRRHALGAAAFYRRLYGPPERGDIRMVIVPRGSSGGYARSGFIVMPTFRKPGDPPPKFDQASPARFVAHEFCHAWLPGVAPGGENYWVSESVAEYLALRYVETTFGIAERDSMLARKRKTAATAGPMVGDRRPNNASLYQKGPVVLFDLEARIGRPTLDRILIRRDRPLTSAAFLAALAAFAGDPVAADFAQDLKRDGLRTGAGE